MSKKKILIKSLSLSYFKGIQSLDIDFENETDIFGANGTGKTTIADSVNWLWFGKDSSDRKDFEVKQLDANGKTNPKTQVEVSAVYSIDGNEVTLKRVLKENWVKKRGSDQVELAGNVTELYWNEVPMTVTEFNKKVDAVLVEQVFKMITSPTFFNDDKSSFGDTKKPAWYNRRQVLIDLVGGDVSNEELAAGNPAYAELIANLEQGKTIDEFKAQIANSVKKAKDDLKQIPTRIDEVNKSRPEAQDFSALGVNLSGYQKQLAKVEEQIIDSSKAFNAKLDAQKDVKIKVNNLEAEITNIESNARREAQQRIKPDTSAFDKLVSDKNAKEQELSTYENTLRTLQSQKDSFDLDAKTLTTKIADKRKEWETENAKELAFGDNDFHCPTCKREFESGDVEGKKAEMLATFKTNKIKKLSEISEQGKSMAISLTTTQAGSDALGVRIENGKKEIEGLKAQIETLKGQIESYNTNTSTSGPSEQEVYESILKLDLTYEAKLKELEATKAQIEEIPTVDTSELTAKRLELQGQITQINEKLASKSQLETIEKRIAQLQEEEQTLAQQVANVEKMQFTIENFIKDKIDRLETAINAKFKMVQFKMFEEQLNGGLKETCVAMVNGVPYTDINTASKINAGIDIINTLSDFYGVTAPVIIDNRESITEIIPTNSQIISLIVSADAPKLTVMYPEAVA
jgi:DNA repair exonuclease SbcCD ATPase subunit